MTQNFLCQKCGQSHQSEWPALCFSSPHYFAILSEEDKSNLAVINDDFCVITHHDQVDRFIRCVLKQKVIDHCLELEYGLWVSVSEKSFQDYHDHFNDENHEVSYFGWMSNFLSEYEFGDSSIPMFVYTQIGKLRPILIPHRDHEHPFVHDFYHGISLEEAERRIKNMMDSLS